MRYFFLTILTVLSLNILAARFSYAVTTTKAPSPSITQTQENLLDQINQLKEKVASKVAELNLVEKKGIVAKIEEVNGNKITVKNNNGTNSHIDVDELTKFSSSDTKSAFGISDMKKGLNIHALGLYNKQTKRILARQINTITLPVTITGTITAIDKVNYTLELSGSSYPITTIDIENVTRTSRYSAENDETIKAGFSKVSINTRAHIVGHSSLNEKNRMTATRIILLEDVKPDPQLKPLISDKPETENVSSPSAKNDAE